MFRIVTIDGKLVNNGDNGNGYTKGQADASVKDRNERAVQMGLSVRYEAVPFEGSKAA